MTRKKHNTYLVTGNTRNDFNNHLGFLSQSKKGQDKWHATHCYLCKRKVGEESVIIDARTHSLRFAPIDLDHWEARIDGICSYEYWLCHECAILAGQLSTYADISWAYNPDSK